MIGDTRIGVLNDVDDPYIDDDLGPEEPRNQNPAELRKKPTVKDNGDGTASIVGECIGMGF